MFVVPPNQRPEIWFVQTVMSEGRIRVQPLKNQIVPVGESEDTFENSDESVFVQCSDEDRGTMVGVVSAVSTLRSVTRTLKSGKAGKKYYAAYPDSKLYPIDSLSTPNEYRKAYQEWMSTGKTPRFSKPEPIKKSSTTSTKSKSILAGLLAKFPAPLPATDGFYVDPLVWSRVILGIHQKENLMLQGDSGCGKTELVYLIAKQFGLDLEMFDMGSKLDPIASLIGSHRHNAQRGGSYFDRAQFTYAIQKKSLVLLDELSRAGAMTNNILLPILDNRKVLQMDLATGAEERTLKVSEDCQFIATANVGFEYSGTQTLDRALEERFRVVKMDYPPFDIEAEILRLRTGVSKKVSETIIKVASTIRSLNRNSELSKGVSLRHTLDAANMEAGGFDLKTALELAFLPFFQYSEEQKVLEVLASR